jgi:hypothetical protein
MDIYGTEITVGDYVEVEIVSRDTSHPLHGGKLTGRVAGEEPDYNMLRLDSGWCCHARDKLLVHKPLDREVAQQGAAAEEPQ